MDMKTKANVLPLNDLSDLKRDTIAYCQKWEANGKPTSAYQCPLCSKTQQTIIPTRSLVGSKGYWDSLTTCYDCGELYFIVKYPVDDPNPHQAGAIHVKLLEP